MEELKKNLYAELADGEIEVANASQVLAKLSQITNGFVVSEDQTLELMPRDKNPRIAAAFEWFHAGDGKAIMWARYQRDVRYLKERAESEGLDAVVYYGPSSDAERRDARQRFNHDPDCQLLIATAGAAGTGNNFQVSGCLRALFYSNTFNYIDRVQAVDRLHRIGTVGTVVITDLIARGGVDRYILRNLEKKKSLSSLVLDDINGILDEIGEDHVEPIHLNEVDDASLFEVRGWNGMI
jgi:superfamily II DNA/RNA helicase